MKKFNPNDSGIYDAYKAPTPDWPLICGMVLAMLGLIGMLVFMMGR